MGDTSKDYVMGVDLGGTKILAGVFTDKLECLGRAKKSTKAQRGADKVVDRIAACVADAIDECDLQSKQIRGIASARPAPATRSPAPSSSPEPRLEELPAEEGAREAARPAGLRRERLQHPGVGRVRKELGGKPKSMVGVFLGTGIGAGIILDGKLWSGFNRTAGEIGHMVLHVGGPKCGCGNKGCFEALASRTAIFRMIETAVKDGQKTVLTDMLGSGLDDMRSGDLRKAIRKGDKLVEKIVEEAAEYTGIAVANIINLLNPQVVVVGGGVMDALEDDMMAVIVETAHDYAMTGTDDGIEIVASSWATTPASRAAPCLPDAIPSSCAARTVDHPATDDHLAIPGVGGASRGAAADAGDCLTFRSTASPVWISRQTICARRTCCAPSVSCSGPAARGFS